MYRRNDELYCSSKYVDSGCLWLWETFFHLKIIPAGIRCFINIFGTLFAWALWINVFRSGAFSIFFLDNKRDIYKESNGLWF